MQFLRLWDFNTLKKWRTFPAWTYKSLQEQIAKTTTKKNQSISEKEHHIHCKTRWGWCDGLELLCFLQDLNEMPLGMHDIWFLVDIQYADILKLIWPITDTSTDIFFLHLLTETTVYDFLHCGIKTQHYVTCVAFLDL